MKETNGCLHLAASDVASFPASGRSERRELGPAGMSQETETGSSREIQRFRRGDERGVSPFVGRSSRRSADARSDFSAALIELPELVRDRRDIEGCTAVVPTGALDGPGDHHLADVDAFALQPLRE